MALACAGGKQQYVILDAEEVSRQSEARVAEVRDVLALGRDAARLLLMLVGWDAERSMNALFELKGSLRDALENLKVCIVARQHWRVGGAMKGSHDFMPVHRTDCRLLLWRVRRS